MNSRRGENIMNFNKLLLLNTINLVMLGLVLFSQSFLAMPIVIAFVILVPCILYSFEIIPSNIALL